jgi:hypothetical protein
MLYFKINPNVYLYLRESTGVDNRLVARLAANLVEYGTPNSLGISLEAYEDDIGVAIRLSLEEYQGR